MKNHRWNRKYHFFENAKNMQGIWFHLIGLAAIIWFCIRVLPAPHRSRYPCQQISIIVALGYIAFWGALFTALSRWLPHARWRASKIAPSIVAVLVVLTMISGVGFTVNILGNQPVQSWDPIPKEPIGTPYGVNPGRVVWTWNPDATEKNLTGFWWEKYNNNQAVINEMYSDGIQTLAGTEDDYEAWDLLFRYFNEEHGNGDVGYQSGEKIAVKINMNNGFWSDYDNEIDDIDANPYVVKGLLHQLVNVVGVAQGDISVFDSSRKLMNWFYYRVYYEEYPASPLVPEFPDVHFVDSVGGATGREQVIPSSDRVYFAAGSCAYRTLPTVVIEADYLINMPITKRHVEDRVTLAGKNWFGSWMESVSAIHNYHTIGYSAIGNPAPQTDLFAHEQLGGKTLLLVGDGTYGCRYGNLDISYFQMYPFNEDWMSSLFFSQDSVALDSVMYDFFHYEGTGGGPSEGAQNYLHQAAEPPSSVYDPENDGIYLSESLGVHEHWDTIENIFSFERYSGPSNNGIDYIAVSEEKLVANASIGWNLISIPFNLSTNLSTITIKYGNVSYNWSDAIAQNIISGSIFGWDRHYQSYFIASELLPGQGYWMYAYEPCELWVQHIPMISDNFITQIMQNWNVISILFNQPLNKTDITVNGTSWSDAVTTGLIDDNVFGWDSTGQYYYLASTFNPGDAYWLYAYYPCILKRNT